MKRFVLSVVIDDKEVVRRACYAENAVDATKLDIFSDEEFSLLEMAIASHQQINFKFEESVS